MNGRSFADHSDTDQSIKKVMMSQERILPYCTVLFDSGEGMFFDLSGNKIAIMDESFYEGIPPGEKVLNILPVDDSLLIIDSKSKLSKFRMLFCPQSSEPSSENTSSRTGSLSS